ncbi:ATP-binding protein [Desulfoluna butyratoxydans]|uniref:histidine kinase n=1 Tax=Desulfoluna butyratoxydans TaxID=231438 RepID=A0A4U8YRW8_9BACT|nr:ATP-binding protein [Desulfoluna butyratoxydans]VFQ44023.1 pas domain [Desulfoluna butyratoxydans]
MPSERKFWSEVPPWIFIGAVVVLLPISSWVTFDKIKRQRENSIQLLIEKGAALIRSFEASTRTGFMADSFRENRKLQKLLFETARQPDISYILVAQDDGRIIAHNKASLAGKHLNLTYQGKELDLKRIAGSGRLFWQIIHEEGGKQTLVIFRRFTQEASSLLRMQISKYDNRVLPDAVLQLEKAPERIIFVGLDMSSVEKAGKIEMQDSLISGVVLLLSGFGGVILLFMIQAYQSTRSSLSRIKAFSDTIVENLPIGLIAFDSSFRILSFNHVAKKVMQLPDNTTGKEARALLPGEFTDRIQELKYGIGMVEDQVECTTPQGAFLPLQVSAAPLRDEENLVTGYLCLFKDLTEVRSLKREVERSRRLASVGKLAAGVAHEIRNPLSSIKGFATYFSERYKDNPNDLNIAQIMIKEVDRLNLVVGQLLEFARPVSLSPKRVELDPFIDNCVKLVSMRARERGITIATVFDDAPETALFDPDKISQVLLNLFLNAIEATEPGGSIDLNVTRPVGSTNLVLTVTDTGCGISDENLAHIFDPYFTTKASGTGLGLAVSHNIVEAHGGEIRIKSIEGEGTAITLVIPTKAEQTDHDKKLLDSGC